MKFTAHQFVAHRTGIRPDAQAAGTVNGPGINVQGVDEALISLMIGAMGASATIDVKVQHSDDDSTYVDITGAAFGQETQAGGDNDDEFVGRIDLTGAKKFIRVVSTVATAAVDVAVAVGLIMGPGTGAGTVNPPTAAQSQKDLPVGQLNPVEFNVTPQAA